MMNAKRRVVIVVALLLVLLGGPLASRELSAQSPTSEILRLVNELRASYGLPPFTYNGQLASAAQSHANWMASTGLYSHTGAGGSSPITRAAGAGYVGYVAENIVGGTGLSPQQGVTWWINSPVHFNTLISNQHNEVGIGFAENYVDDFNQNFYVLVAGHQNGSAAIAASPQTTAARQPDELFVVAPVVLSVPREDGSIVHTVGSGQSLWTIAARYEVGLQELLLFNNLTEESVINPGDELLVRWPEGANPPPTPTPPTTYKVRSGDSAWTIAARFRISLDDFLWFNSMSEDGLLEPGDTVTIRLTDGQPLPPTPTPQLTHRVKSGQTFWEIALIHGLTIEELLGLNGLAQNAVLSIGQELYIRPTEMPPPTATSYPPTFTPAPTADLNAGSAETAQMSALFMPTPTPLVPAMAEAVRAQQPESGRTTPPATANQVTSDWTSDWTLGAAVAFFVVAFFLLGIVMILLVRRLAELSN